MLLIPAIDLKDGHCVRLKQGDMDQATTFSEDPAAMASRWLEAGARRLHLVDLNGAFAGKPQNMAAIKAILKAVGQDIPVATTKANLKRIYEELIAAGKIVTTATLIPSLYSAGSAVLANISAGVSSFSCATTTGAGNVLVLGSTGNTETVTVSSVTGSGPYTIGLTAPTTKSHVTGEPFSNITRIAMMHDINQWIDAVLQS